VTEAAGLPGTSRGYGHGVAVGDYDNDGRPDLFVTRWRSYALYRNRGDGTFADVTDQAGLGGDRDWPTSAAFADLDNDGDLDLYVCHYLRWDADHPRICRNLQRSIDVSCDPRSFEALPDHLFRNDAGRFTDVTARSGLVDRDGRGLGVVAVDIDDDNRVDLFVANDLSANYLLRNAGDLHFDEQGLAAGVACNSHGGYQAGMGVAAGDLDGDGRLDLVVTNFFNESTTFFRNLGDGQFADYTTAVGLAAPSRDLLGFGAAFLDADDDGRLDLMTANGHLNDYRPDVPYTMPVQLLLGRPGGLLGDVTAQAGPALTVPHIGRGLAIGDLDNDGRIDAVLVPQNEPLVYLHNRTEGGHSVTIALEGTRSNRDGVGARVEIEAGGSRRVSQRLGGGSYLSANDPRLHFGLGPATRVDRIEVRWPSGRVDVFRDLDADTAYRLREADPSPRPLWKVHRSDRSDPAPRARGASSALELLQRE
jgi:enediyne biosynthesis protein E4